MALLYVRIMIKNYVALPWKGASALILQRAGTPTGVRNCENLVPVVSQTALNHRLHAATPPGSRKSQSPAPASLVAN
jgi:hypothetical protein